MTIEHNIQQSIDRIIMQSPFKIASLEFRKLLAPAALALASLFISCGDIYSDLVENEGFPYLQSPFQFVEDWESGSDGWIEDYKINPISLLPEADAWSITSAVFVSGSNSLQMQAFNNWNWYDGLHYEFGKAIRPTYIGFYIQKSTEANFPQINIGGDTTSGDGGSIFFRWDDFWGDYTLNNPSTKNTMFVTDVFGINHMSSPIMGGAFHLVEFRNINFSTQTYDFYVDGALIAPFVLFRSPAFAFTRLYISLGWYGTNTHIDDIVITGYELVPM